MARRASEAACLSQYRGSRTSAAFGNTIVSVPQSPLRPLCIEESDTLPPQIAPSQRLFKIRLVDDHGHREAAGLLVKRRYAWRVYQVCTADRVQPNHITLSACNPDDV